MSQAQIMSQEEKTAIALKAIEFKNQGKLEEYEKTMKQIPLAPYLAKIAKENFGAETLIKTGWDLTAAEAEFGPNWLAN